jgi:hypothetical protein
MRALSLAAAIVAVYAVELLALEVRIHTGHASALEPGLPLVTIGKPFFAIGAATNALVAMCALAQAALLYLLATVKTHDTRLLRFAIPLGVAAMLALSLRTTFTNSDVYYYVYYGKSATLADAYTPRAEIPPLPAGFTGLNHVLTAPVVASVYGPAWQQFDRALVGPTRSLPQAVATVRLASAAALALTLLLVAALRLPATLTAAVALNPALYYAYAVQSHNDVYAVLATVAGLALLRLRSPALAALGGEADLGAAARNAPHRPALRDHARARGRRARARRAPPLRGREPDLSGRQRDRAALVLSLGLGVRARQRARYRRVLHGAAGLGLRDGRGLHRHLRGARDLADRRRPRPRARPGARRAGAAPAAAFGARFLTRAGETAYIRSPLQVHHDGGEGLDEQR